VPSWIWERRIMVNILIDDPRLAEADGYLVKNFGALGKLKQKIADVIG
jgi:hypothetical protein